MTGSERPSTGGDATRPSGVLGNSQDRTNLLGKILRIDPLASGSAPYTVPDDNPFVGQADTIQETWAYGLRNPHRLAWDSVTGKMLISDIGQVNVEEINLGTAGANYGWDLREGDDWKRRMVIDRKSRCSGRSL